MVIGASGFYVWPFNCDAPSSNRSTSRNIANFVESISRIRLISRIIINQVKELSPLLYIAVHHKTIYKRKVFPIHWCIR